MKHQEPNAKAKRRKSTKRKAGLPGPFTSNSLRRTQTRKAPSIHESTNPSGGFPIVGIGASAGGLEAFTQLLKHLPNDTGLGFVFVQHLDPQHESALTQLLTRATSIPVREATNNLRVEPNHIYVIPPNTNLSLSHGVLKLQPRPDSRAPARSVDFFFESLAQNQREHAIGVILSGTATDGTLGLEAIKAEGGITFAQDDSAKYDSMPRSAIAAGCVDFILKPEGIAKELARIARHPFVAAGSGDLSTLDEDRHPALAQEDNKTSLRMAAKGTSEEAAETPTKSAENAFNKILLLLRNHSGVDFSLYKPTTIQRRIARRIVLNKKDTMEEYTHFLRGNSKELEALYSDILISVTSFFRNPEAFEFLKRKVFPKLLQQRGDDPIRAWVLGCSTGQEAYSIAMAFIESAENAARPRKLQVFATDLNDALLDKARHGLYSKTLVQDVSSERLRRFFAEEQGGYRVIKPLREIIVFARQNLISDPPFSRMDLISCRNLLIYLEPGLHEKALPTFHYALKPGGFLLLGSSESVGGFTDLFEPVDKKRKIYSKKAASATPLHLPIRNERDSRPASKLRPLFPTINKQTEPPQALRGELTAQREADRVSVTHFVPPGVLIDADFQILQFRGPTGAYLQPPSAGKASFDLLKMAREGLMLPLRAAINKAKKENKAVRKEGIRVQQNGTTRTVNVEIIPLKNLRERSFLVLFEDPEQARRGPGALPTEQPIRRSHSGTQASHRILSLEAELADTRDYLQSVQEQYEAANEELQASNEEIQSANEELQSVNEELETSKEELESSNEELTTLNDEMGHRNTELNRLNADLGHLQNSTKLPIIWLGGDLTVRRFTMAAEKLFNLLSTDLGRPLRSIRHNLTFPGESAATNPSPNQSTNSQRPLAPSNSDQGGRQTEARPSIHSSASVPFPLEDFVHQVIDTVQEQEQEVCAQDRRWYSLRAGPYMTVDKRIDGAVLVLVDIDDLKRAEERVTQARDYAEVITRTARQPLVILRADLKVDKANEAFHKMFQVSQAETENVLIYQVGNGQWDIPKLRQLLEEIIPRNTFFNDLEVTHNFPDIGRRTMLLNARRLDNPSGLPERILLGIEDITEHREAQESLSKLVAQLQDTVGELEHFSYTITHDMRAPLRAMQNYGALLLDRCAAELTPDSADYLRRITQAAHRLDALIRDSLQYAKVVRNKIPLTSVEPSLVLRGILESYPNLQPTQGQIQIVEPLPPVLANEAGLGQCFSNLLANAIKFVKPGQVPQIRIWGEEVERVTPSAPPYSARVAEGQVGLAPSIQQSSIPPPTVWVRFWIEDNGIGIPPQYRERIFDMFQQLNKSYEGTGIGLALVRKTVERMEGKVGVESEPGKGSRFWLEFKKATTNQ